MNRREFSAGAACVVGAAVLGVPGLAWAQRAPKEGTEYRVLDRPVPVEAAAGRIEVIEFFWYSCRHCFAFEPKLVAWIKRQPADVLVRRIPVGFRDDFAPQQRLFYTLEAMGKLEELHQQVFDAIHMRQEPTAREPEILAFAAKHGLDRAKFIEHYNSFSVSNKARRATQVQNAFKVEGVPSIGIAGRYLTDGDMAGNMDRALQVTDYLVAEARKLK